MVLTLLGDYTLHYGSDGSHQLIGKILETSLDFFPYSLYLLFDFYTASLSVRYGYIITFSVLIVLPISYATGYLLERVRAEAGFFVAIAI